MVFVCGRAAPVRVATALFRGAPCFSVAVLCLVWGGGPVALALGALALAATAGAVLVKRRKRRLARSVSALREAAAVRLLWSALGDIRPGGWAHRDLEALRLLTLNIGADQQLGQRLAARLDDAASAVFLRALDRLDDIARLAGELDVAPAPTRRLVSALRVLAVELAGARFVSGAPAPCRPQVVALACGAAIEACDQLEAAVRPSVAVDAATLARRVASLRYGDLLRNGRLTLGVAGRHGRLAAVRSEDLAEAIEGALHLVFAGARSAGPAQLIVADSADAVTVEIAWSAQLTPAQGRVLIEPLRPLAAYGARVVWEQVPHEGVVRLLAALPPVDQPLARGRWEAARAPRSGATNHGAH